MCRQRGDSISFCPIVRFGIHGRGVGARVERAAQAGVERASHALQQERGHWWGVSSEHDRTSGALFSVGKQHSTTE